MCPAHFFKSFMQVLWEDKWITLGIVWRNIKKEIYWFLVKGRK